MRGAVLQPQVDIVNSRLDPSGGHTVEVGKWAPSKIGVNPQKCWLMRNLAIDRPKKMFRSRFLMMKLSIHMNACVRSCIDIFLRLTDTAGALFQNTRFEDPGVLQVAHARMVSIYATHHIITRTIVEYACLNYIQTVRANSTYARSYTRSRATAPLAVYPGM